jgi:hypothetical protein
MKALKREMILLAGSIIALAGTAAAQTVVVAGTGDPDLDVPAVQAAVDQGGSVVLRGHFSFDRPPTTPAGATISRMVTVSKSVAISGSPDASGDLPTIEGGEWPLLVDAIASRVTIQGLHFVRPTAGAIWIYAVSGLLVTGCRIENIDPSATFGTQAGLTFSVSTAIFVGSDPHPPSQTQLGKPDNFSGTLAILNNDIDLGGPPVALSLGVVMFNVGKAPDNIVNIYVSGNNIRNSTEPLINFRIIGGQAYAERNVLTTGTVMGGSANPDAIRVVGAGSYLIAHNSVDCGWVDGAAAGINVIGQ